MPDLRERVEEDRGLLKRIQLHVPGFAGYRRREDIRAADSMLRIQMANMLKDARVTTERAREVLTENYHFKDLDKIGRLINRFQTVEGKVRHAEGGYSGISATIRVEEPELDSLYEYDASLLSDAASMAEEATALKAAVGGGDQVPERLAKLTSLLDAFEDTFTKRLIVITGTEVSE